jgi:hypothetical protein
MRGMWLAILVCSACDGVGAPIVGEIPIPEGTCGVTPLCHPIRTVEAERFEVPAERRQTRADCDGDDVPDILDLCPAHPDDLTAGGEQCVSQRAACDRFNGGVTSLAGADLRGCFATLVDPNDLDLRRADLSCAVITIHYTELRPRAIDLSHAMLAGASLEIVSQGPLAIVADQTTFDGAIVAMRGGARISAHGAIVRDSVLITAPGGSPDAVAPSIELVLADLRASAIVEEPGGWPGRVRIELGTFASGTIHAQVLEIADATFTDTFVGARELHVLHASLEGGAVRADFGLFAAARLTDVIFDRCVDLAFSACELSHVDIPACEPEGLRIVESDVDSSTIGGGAAIIESTIESSVIGGGPGSVVRTERAILDGVGVCDLAAGAFVESELRCMQCGAGAFPDGVCVDAEITERGCPAIELAPACG